MHRRRVLLGAVGCLCLGACAPLSSSSHRGARRPGDRRGGSSPSGSASGEARAGANASGEAIELSIKPVSESGALARQTGHCDIDGVLAARGSKALARQACERDLEVEHDLAEGLKLSTAAHVQNDGRARHMAGDIEQAQHDYQEAIRRDTDGRDPSAVTAFARINLGLLHHEQGDQAAAQQHLAWVLEHSTDDAVRGAAHHNLALVLLAQEDLDGALEAATKGHDLLLRALGANHGSVGASLNALGVIHAERDELPEAVDMLEAAVDTRTAALGRLHPATAASYTNLGVALGRQAHWDDALLAHREALSIDQEVLGPEHATTAADHGHVGAALMELGRPGPARTRFEAALAILEPERPFDDPEVERLHAWLKDCDAADAVLARKSTALGR